MPSGNSCGHHLVENVQTILVPVPVVVKVKVYFSKCIFKKSPILFFSVKIKRCVISESVSDQ